jgi:glyoxylase-like metal-dependent hydrolase (beta-lactamase superfamily II)
MTAAPDIRVQPVRFNNVHGYLVTQDNNALLVDTGYDGMQDRVVHAMEKAGLSEHHLKLIILTHTHFDHAGGACELKKMTGAPIAVHRLEAEFLQRGRTPIPPGTRWKGKIISWVGRTFYRKIEKYPSVRPDILVEDELLLTPYGINGKICHTPGHTQGSLSVVLDNGTAIVGDVMMGISLKEHFPPFAMDKRGVIRSWERLLETSSRIFLPAHGHRVSRQEIIDELPLAKKKYG